MTDRDIKGINGPDVTKGYAAWSDGGVTRHAYKYKDENVSLELT
jgi:hypothetical protein